LPEGPSGATCSTSALPVKGVLRLLDYSRKTFFEENQTFLKGFNECRFLPYFKGVLIFRLRQFPTQTSRNGRVLTLIARQISESLRRAVAS
jgi:hypothetical protein